MFGVNKAHIEALQDAILELQSQIQELKENNKAQPLPPDINARVAELELKVAKLWTVLVKIDARGTERPTNTARKMFGGRSKQFLE